MEGDRISLKEKMMGLVPFDYALNAYRQLDLRGRTLSVIDKFLLDNATRHKREGDVCRICGFPRGERGFIMMLFPVGHPLFGKSICCPECWPAPFGHAYGDLDGEVAQIARLWEKVMED